MSNIENNYLQQYKKLFLKFFTTAKEENVPGRPTKQGQKNLEDYIKHYLDTDNLTEDGQKTYLQNLINDGNLTDIQKKGFFYCFYKIHNVKKKDAESIKKDSSFQKFLKNVNFQELLKNFTTSEKEKVGDAQKLTEVVELKPTLKGQKKLKNLILKLQKANKLIYSQKSYLKNLISLPDLTDEQKLKFFTTFCREHDLDIPTLIDTHNLTDGQKTYLQNLTNRFDLTHKQKLQAVSIIENDSLDNISFDKEINNTNNNNSSDL